MKTNETVVICGHCDRAIMPEESNSNMRGVDDTLIWFCSENCHNTFEEELIDAHR